MASGGHLLQQQHRGVRSAISLLKNDDLKKICKDYGQQVSGVKNTLVDRCHKVLDDAVNSGDVNTFEDLKRRTGLSNLPSLLHDNRNGFNAPSYPSSGHTQYNMPPQRAGGTSQPPRLPTGGKFFKPSPFYEVLETLLPLQDLPEMPQNRHTVKASMVIKNDIAQQLRMDSNLRILMYCGVSHSMSSHTPADVAFPPQIEVKVNDQDVKANFKGLKNKAGSTKPADITSLVRKLHGQDNTIQVTYALTTKRFAYIICLVRYVSPNTLVERIKKGNVIPKDKVLREMNKANADPDIAATSIRMSLKDPVSTLRISLPVRSSHCTHNQCFDGAFFLQLQEQAPQWSCPVCSKVISFESLCVDKYFEDILNRSSKNIEKVDLEPNGEWKGIKEEDNSQANGTSSKGQRASYDDDFDDDLLELDPPTSRPVNGIKRESWTMPSMSPMTGTLFPMNTPPLSSREPSVAQSASSAQLSTSSSKRPQSAIIDLTLSDEDDDDDPPRPAKRQSTNHQQHYSSGNHTNSYHTPTSIPSLPDLRYQQHNYGQADTYRPGSNHSLNYGAFGNSNMTALSNSASPSEFGRTSWSGKATGKYSRPPAQQQQQQQTTMFPPSNSAFVIRPPSAQSGMSAHSSGLRLPPMQTHPPNNSNSPDPNPWTGWRSDYDYSNFSQSPG